MNLKERIKNARKELGDEIKIIMRRKPGTKKKTKPVSSFIPRKTKSKRNMSRSEYLQCGKKTRYNSESDAKKYAAKLSKLRGYAIRVYGPCAWCKGYHLTHKPNLENQPL